MYQRIHPGIQPMSQLGRQEGRSAPWGLPHISREPSHNKSNFPHCILFRAKLTTFKHICKRQKLTHHAPRPSKTQEYTILLTFHLLFMRPMLN
ncbi:hypothetical protein FKM82_009095 [Ascaphus truei]